MQLEKKSHCPICGGKSFLIGLSHTINPHVDDTVELLSCNICGHWWHSPMPTQDELNQLYGVESLYVVSDGARNMYQSKTKPDNFQNYVLSQVCSSKALNYLEIGTGGGHLLNRFRKLGYNCYGVDPGKWIDDPAIVNDFNQIPEKLDFSIFILQDVLEHLKDPVDMMKKLRSKSKKNAMLFCSFPCNDSRPAKRSRERWSMIRPYGHLHYFSYESTKRMLLLSGWVIEDILLTGSAAIKRNDYVARIFQILKYDDKDQLYLKVIAN